MTAFGRHPSSDYDDKPAYGLDDDGLPLGPLSAGERIGPPSKRAGRKTTFALSALLLIGLGGAWYVYGDQLGDLAVSLASPPAKQDAASAAPPATPEAVKPEAASPAPLAPIEASAAPRPVVTAALPPAAAEYDAVKPEPLARPVADPADPHQQRALAAGLHPGLSRALLSRLTAADFKNAATAVQTALGQPGEDTVTVWPKPRKPEQALFEVHFVPAAEATCRRYVVTVEKDGWVTTALPLEKCGAAQTAKRG